MDKNKVITYSLLAYINNSSTLSTGLLDLFVPIVKKAIYELITTGITKGGHISEIKSIIDKLYGLDIPLPILRKLLFKLQKEVNTEEIMKLQIYSDGAFATHNYDTDDFDEIIKAKEKEISGIEALFIKFCEANRVKKQEYTSVFDFINKNKLSIARYLGSNQERLTDTQTSLLIEAQFIDYFRKVPEVYNTIRNIYLGSIISTYIEYRTEGLKTEVELLYDTNFIIGLLDLNTPESSHTCSKLVELANRLGYRQSIMDTTINEIRNLLKARAENFDGAYLVRKINREDIYNACERRNLTKTDLQKIADNIEAFLTDHKIFKITNTEKYKNQAKFSKEYEVMRELRNSDRAALHDASAIYYVREKRNKPTYTFEDVNCWFVHNSVNTFKEPHLGIESKSGKPLSESIKVDDLLNILWLSNPGFSQALNQDELTDFGLNALISSTLSDALPKAALIRDLDNNIKKYVSDNTLNELDIIRVATRISNRELTNIEELNILEKDNSKEFIEKIKQVSEEQKAKEEDTAKKFDALFSEISKTENLLKKKHATLEKEHDNFKVMKEQALNDSEKAKFETQQLKELLAKERETRLKLENERRAEKREIFIASQLKKWRFTGWIEIGVCLGIFTGAVIWILFKANWSAVEAGALFRTLSSNIIFISTIFIANIVASSFIIKSQVEKYRNQSNIKAFKDQIKIPNDLQDLKSIE